MGVGRIEIVLSIIFQIMSNIIRDTSTSFQEQVTMFKNLFVEKSIKLAINIMTKNQERICVEEEEELEKTTLSLSILNYFKFISKDNDIKHHLEVQGLNNGTMKKILHAE